MNNKRKKTTAITIFSLAFGLTLSSMSFATIPALLNTTPVTTPTTDTTPDYVFTSDEPGQIIYGGDCTSNKTTAIAGENLVTFKRLKSGNHGNCFIQVKNAGGYTSAKLLVPGFSVTYSMGGKLTVTSAGDTDLDNIVDTKWVTIYDQNGRIVKDSVTVLATNSTRVFESSAYDSHGNITSNSEDQDDDGVFDEVVKFVNTYNAKGNLTKTVETTTYLGVKFQSVTTTYTYDSKNNITSTQKYDAGCQCSFPASSYIYGSNGKLASKKTDSYGDGIIDKIESYTYNVKGSIAKYTKTENGRKDSASGTYNSKNQLTKITETNNLISASIFYNTNGAPNLVKFDFTGDGAFDELNKITYTGDAGIFALALQGLFHDIL